MNSEKEKDKSRKYIGKLGEEITCIYLKNNGFKVLDQNYWKPWGEIDVIAKKGNKIHFVEVKSVSCENIENVSCENKSGFNPFEKIHQFKLKRLERTIFSYLNDKNNKIKGVSNETDFCLDGVVVYVSNETKEAKVCVINDIL